MSDKEVVMENAEEMKLSERVPATASDVITPEQTLLETIQEKELRNKNLETQINAYSREIEELKAKLLLYEKEKEPKVEEKVPELEAPSSSLAIHVPDSTNNNTEISPQKTEGSARSPLKSFASQDEDINNENALRKEIDAGDFLFRRANSLHSDAWYERAQPLYDEGCLIYEKLYGYEGKETLEAYRLKAVNLWKNAKYHSSYDLFKQLLETMGKLYGDQHEDYITVECDLLYLLMDMGQFSLATERVEFIISHYTLKLENASNLMPVPASTPSSQQKNSKTKDTGSQEKKAQRIGIILGRVLCIQSLIYVHEGKLNEAKAVSERAQAVFSQAVGLNNLHIIEAFQTKAKVLLALAKPKEAISLMEQSSMVLKGLLKTTSEATSSVQKTSNQLDTLLTKEALDSPNRPKPQSQPKNNNVVPPPAEIEHPILAECQLIHARALMIQCSFLEAKNKLAKVKRMRLKFFPPTDFRVLEVDYYEGNVMIAISNYAKAMTIHEQLLETCEIKVGNIYVKPEEVATDGDHSVASLQKSTEVPPPSSPSGNKKPMISPSNRSRSKLTTNNLDDDVPPAVMVYPPIDQLNLKSHPVLANSYFAMGLLYYKLGNYTFSKEFFNKTVLQLQENNAPNHLLSYESKIYLLSIMQCLGQYDDSYPYIEDALEKIRKGIHKEHLLFLQLLLLQAQHFQFRKEYSEAENLFMKCLKSMKLNYTNGHALIPYIMLDLIWLFIHQENYAEAFKYFDECKMLAQMVFGAFIDHEIFIALESVDTIFTVYDYRERLSNHDLASLTCAGKGGDEGSLDGIRSITGERAKAEADLIKNGTNSTSENNNGEQTAATENNNSAIEKSKTRSGSVKTVEGGAVAPSGSEKSIPRQGSTTSHALSQRSQTSLQAKSTSSHQLSKAGSHQSHQPTADNNDEENEDDDPLDPDTIHQNNKNGDQHSVNSMPSYNNEVFVHLIQSIEIIVDRFARLFEVKPKSLPGGDSSNALLPGSFLSIYMKGLLGEANLMEFVSSQQYIQSLSSEQRELYYAHQAEKAALKLNSTKPEDNKVVKSLEPPGKSEMEASIELLKLIILEHANSFYLKDLETEYRSLELQFDELEIAKFQLSKAKELKKYGKFLEADKFFDESFVLFFHCLGNDNAAKSLIIAEILFEKAENGRYLSKNVDYVKNLHLLAIRVYRQATAPKTGGEHGPSSQPTTKELNNHQFIWKNLLALSQLFVDQKLFDEVLPMHKSLHDIIVTSSIPDHEHDDAGHGEDAAALLQKKFPHYIALMFERNEFIRLQYLIKAKICLAKDLLHLHRYEEALKYDSEAMELLKKLSIASASFSSAVPSSSPSPRGTSAAGNKRPKSSVDFADGKNNSSLTAGAVIPPEQNNILAEYLIHIYCNEIQIHDYLGNFSLSEEFLVQIESILSSWIQSEDESLNPTGSVPSSSPKSPASKKRTDSKNNNKAVTFTNEKDNKDSKEATPPVKRSGAIQFLQSEVLLIRSQHLLILSKTAECNDCIQQAFEIRRNLFNLVREVPKNSFVSKKATSKDPKKDKDAKKGKSSSTEFEWTPQKEEEIKMKFLVAIESLITTDFMIQHHNNTQRKKEHLKKTMEKNHRIEPILVASVGSGKKEGEDDDDEEGPIGHTNDPEGSLDDIESMLLTVHELRQEFHGADASSQMSATNATSNNNSHTDELTIKSFIPKESTVFEYNSFKLSSSMFFVEVIFQIVKLSHLLGQVSLCKLSLDTVMGMFYDFYPQYKSASFNTLYKLSFVFYFAKYKLLINQIEESKNLHLKILENQLSLIVHGLEYSLELSQSYQTIGEIYLLLGQMDVAMQYINDALKIERKCFSLVPHSNNSSSNLHLASHLMTKDSHYRIQAVLILCAEILTFKCCYYDSNQLCDSILLQLKTYFAAYHELHFSIALVYQLKGKNELGLSKFESCLNYFQMSKNMLSVVFFEDHYHCGILYLNYAQVMRAMGKLLETKQYLDLAIKSIRTNLGKYHYYTILTIYEISLNFMDLGKYNTADHILQRSLHLLKKLLGKDHLLIAYMTQSLGELYLKMGFLEKVQEPLEESLFITRKVMGTDRFPLVPVILGTMNELKNWKGIYDIATQGIESALSMMKLIYSSVSVTGGNSKNGDSNSSTLSHFAIIKLLFIYANILFAQGRYYDAFLQYDKIYHLMKSLYPQDHPILYEAQYGVANCYLLLGRLDHAKALYERCLQAMKDWKGSMHPFVGSILNKLGDVYNCYCKFLLAENLLKEAWNIRVKSVKDCNENHPDIAENLLSIVENLRLRGLYDLTVNFNKTAASHQENAIMQARRQKEQEELRLKATTQDPFEILDGKKDNKDPSSANLKTENDDLWKDNAEETTSQPTIAISQIENLDQNSSVQPSHVNGGDKNNDNDSKDIQAMNPNDPNYMFLDTKNYKAMPILNKCSQLMLVFLENDTNHPFYLKTRYLQAEITKGLGKYEKALELHETLFQQRRKILSETHLDTIQSLIAIAELLRIMKRVFGNNNVIQKMQHSMASDPNNMIGYGPKMTGNVTLIEHLTAIALPMKFSKDKKKKKTASSNDEFHDYGNGGDEDEMDLDSNEIDGLLAKISQKKTLELVKNDQWKFISKPDDSLDAKEREKEKEKRKGAALKKGYMGYAFPTLKKEVKTMNVDTLFGGNNNASDNPATGAANSDKEETNNNSMGNADPKKCLDLAISLIKKLFRRDEENEENGNAGNSLFQSLDHPYLAQCLYNKAEIARIKGDGMLALKLLEQSLGMRRKIFRSHHPSIADCLYSMAELLRTDQRYLQALPIYDKAMEIRMETYGSYHPAIAEIQNSIALLYMSLGNFTKAKDLLTEALSVCEIILGIKHPSTALIYNNQAGLLQSMGNYQEAINWNKKTLIIKQQLYSENHPEIANTLNNLGLLYKATKNYEKAQLYFEKALEIQKNFFTNNHPEIATTLNNIGALLSCMDGKKFEAKEFFKQSLSIRMVCFGEDNALVASTMNNYAGLLYQLNEFTQAKELFEQALAIRRKIFQEDHPAISESYHNLGYFYFSQKYYLDAKYYYEEAYKIRKKCYEEDHFHLSNTMIHLFFVYDALKMFELAYSMIDAVYQVKLKKFKDDARNPEVVYAKELLDYLEKKLLNQKNNLSKSKQNNNSNLMGGPAATQTASLPSLGGPTGSTSSFVKKKKQDIAKSQNNNNNDLEEVEEESSPVTLGPKTNFFESSSVSGANLALGEAAMEI
jgi:tetratricopeptide (TPR) repeat protein